MHRFLAGTILLLTPLLSPAGTSPKTVRAERVVTGPVIDGVLADSVWRLAVPATEFTQRDPVEGQPESERTEIRILYDDHSLYVGCMFYDAMPEGIVSRLMRRDEEGESDRGSIRLDTFHDHQNAYEFTFNPAGVKVDILQFDDGEREDVSWDAVWDLETRITEDGWSAELRIPFSVLRYPSAAGDVGEQVWGVNFIRWITRKGENTRWAFTPKSESGFISRFGTLTGLRDLPSPRRVELLPFVVTRQEWIPATDVRPRTSVFRTDGGLDLKMGIGNNITLDATVNPDFGQVEADPAVLNLSAFETFYPEKRPFFIEGMQIMRFLTFGEPGLFYSRRIGRAISPDEASVPEGGILVEAPANTTILGAAKLSGKFNGGTSVGIVEALTAEETVLIRDSSGGESTGIVEPLAHYNVIRVRQDILNGSYVGGMMTSVAKKSRLPAFTGGVDWNLRLGDRTFQVEGFFAGSQATVGGERVSGAAGRLELSRIAARHWLWGISADFTSPRYNINDVGFFRRPNDFGGNAQLVYKEQIPSVVAREYWLEFSLHQRRNFDGAELNRQAGVEADVLFLNYWWVSTEMSVDAGEYDDRETRGNGLYAKPVAYGAALDVGTDERQTVSITLDNRFHWDAHRKFAWSGAVELEVRPTTWTEWSLGLGYELVRRQEAWVDNVHDEASPALASIFADRRTDSYDVTLRGDVTFTRDLTLQVYSQLFLAKGYHENFRRLQGVADFTPYPYAGKPDFNDQTFNLNVVLRWEYLPGSTLYLVWSQLREGENGEYFTTARQDVREVFRVPPANVVSLKVSYWWSV